MCSGLKGPGLRPAQSESRFTKPPPCLGIVHPYPTPVLLALWIWRVLPPVRLASLRLLQLIQNVASVHAAGHDLEHVAARKHSTRVQAGWAGMQPCMLWYESCVTHQKSLHMALESLTNAWAPGLASFFETAVLSAARDDFTVIASFFASPPSAIAVERAAPVSSDASTLSISLN
mmetsp:Transcript_33726/g.88705  ORF Transcript_33726/g.88705 Transcript_33726/m.88705 type:complete len:175 (-) Transcript_33726:479-1003(-)